MRPDIPNTLTRQYDATNDAPRAPPPRLCYIRTVCASLADSKASKSVLGGVCFIGALFKTAFCYGAFFIFLGKLSNLYSIFILVQQQKNMFFVAFF